MVALVIVGQDVTNGKPLDKSIWRKQGGQKTFSFLVDRCRNFLLTSSLLSVDSEQDTTMKTDEADDATCRVTGRKKWGRKEKDKIK